MQSPAASAGFSFVKTEILYNRFMQHFSWTALHQRADLIGQPRSLAPRHKIANVQERGVHAARAWRLNRACRRFAARAPSLMPDWPDYQPQWRG